MYLWKYTAKPVWQAIRSSCFVAGGCSVDSISKTGITKITPIFGCFLCTIFMKLEASRTLGKSSMSETSTRNVFAVILATFRATLMGYVMLLFLLSVLICRHWTSEAKQSLWVCLLTFSMGGWPIGKIKWTETCYPLNRCI